MIFQKKLPNYKEGAYGVVFFTEDGFAIKVFKTRGTQLKYHTESVFDSEVQAYGLATSDPILKKLVPNFFGQVTVEKITDENGVDISHQFELDLAYKMKKVDGDFIKMRLNCTHLESLFKAAGINHLSDTSLIIRHGKVSCVVDFAVVEHQLEHTDL